MLQYITRNDKRYSLAEQMQMAIEGGCAWIVVGHDGTSDQELRTLAEEFLPLCRETSTILTFENRPELARELGVHGVLLSDKELHAAKMREELGPEAIIGVVCDNAPAIVALRRADIDYVQFPAMPVSELATIIMQVREAGTDTALVATGDFTPDNIYEVIAAGANGIATTAYILDAEDPVSATGALIAALNNTKNNSGDTEK